MTEFKIVSGVYSSEFERRVQKALDNGYTPLGGMVTTNNGFFMPMGRPKNNPGLTADHPEADGTDAAHPAWWRGQDQGITVLCWKINRILDGLDDSHETASEPWEPVKQRLLRLATIQATLVGVMIQIRERLITGDIQAAERLLHDVLGEREPK